MFSRSLRTATRVSRVANARAFSATAGRMNDFPTVEKGQSLWNFTEEENMLRDSGRYLPRAGVREARAAR